MKMSEDKLTKLIKKMINVIKPNGVLDIEFRLVPLGIRDDEFYMETTYIVPDDSPLLNMGKSPRSFNDIRMGWNNELKKSIKKQVMITEPRVPFLDEVEEFNAVMGKPNNYEPVITERKEWELV